MMSITTDAQRNKLMHLENSLIIYGVYNAETLSKLVKTVQVVHSCKTLVEQFDVDFSYCQLNLEVSWYSLEQYIGCIIRQAFNYCCSLLQV